MLIMVQIRLESYLFQSLIPEQQLRLDSYCHDAAQCIHQTVKNKQSLKFNQLAECKERLLYFPVSD